jgi:hypothetical protein
MARSEFTKEAEELYKSVTKFSYITYIATQLILYLTVFVDFVRQYLFFGSEGARTELDQLFSNVFAPYASNEINILLFRHDKIEKSIMQFLLKCYGINYVPRPEFSFMTHQYNFEDMYWHIKNSERKPILSQDCFSVIEPIANIKLIDKSSYIQNGDFLSALNNFVLTLRVDSRFLNAYQEANQQNVEIAKCFIEIFPRNTTIATIVSEYLTLDEPKGVFSKIKDEIGHTKLFEALHKFLLDYKQHPECI